MDSVSTSLKIVEESYELYKDEEYIQKYMHNFFTTQFKPMLENAQKNHQSRKTHNQEMTEEQEKFIHRFLNTNKYYYVQNNNRFIFYDEKHYILTSEDDVLHHILTEITKDNTLISWKQKTKVAIMKRIKENVLYKTIPNSETIQHVLDLFCPLLFQTKTEAKFFLTVLGDNLLKKNGDIIHIITSKSKTFLSELNYCFQMLVGGNSTHTFRHKYHEHAYRLCRLIKINDLVKTETIWKHIMPHCLDILAVCFHYSARYGNADEFIQHKNNDKTIANTILFLHNHSQETIVDMFISEYMYPVSVSTSSINTYGEISWKAMQYLWKHFLDTHKLPAIIFQANLKQVLIDKWQKMENASFNEPTEHFVGMFSKYLPSIQNFLQFWKDTMIYEPTEMDLELDEIAMLYCKYTNNNASITEKQVADFISHFLPDVEIENDKYVQNYKCLLWDKTEDILACLNDSDVSGSLFSIYDLYEKYCEKNYQQKKPSANKQYFEKFVSDIMNK
jgi:hypothetical protein